MPAPLCRLARLAGCALLPCALFAPAALAQTTPPPRKVIGVALGGGSARGLAHVGVIRWLEEHHIPIDRIAGTSMGGLIGGAYASGMSSDELETMLARIDWDDMFGPRSYRYKAIRRKEDARAYPSPIEFQTRSGIAPPVALNNGQQVDLLLARIGGVYGTLATFDSLPTPFRCVATDLKTARPVVLGEGSLATAMRATMSLPGVFPPISLDSALLVDGGALNNVPADVVRSMGANVVIAVVVGSLTDTLDVRPSIFSLIDATTAAMMRANTRRIVAGADLVLSLPTQRFGALDWRRAKALEAVGYRSAAAMSPQLLPLAIDAEAWRAYQEARAARRRTALPVVAALEIQGATSEDARLMRRRLAPFVGRTLDIPALEHEITLFGSLDRYFAIDWRLIEAEGGTALSIRAYPRPAAPPLLMFGLNAQNVTSEEFTLQAAARLLAFDVLTPGSELRIDAALGSNRRLGAELRDAFRGSMLFAAATVVAADRRADFTNNGNSIVAQYQERLALGQLDVGVTPGPHLELRAGVQAGYYSARVEVGNPGLPSLSGGQRQLLGSGIYDDQDNAAVPSAGLRIVGNVRHVLRSPALPITFVTQRSNIALTQAELTASQFWSWHEKAQRIFVAGGGGSSFGNLPLPTDQFVLGAPFRLDAFSLGARRGDYYAALTGGYLLEIGRLPDFLGGPVMIGGWLETGSAFDLHETTPIYTQLGFGTVIDTMFGPALASYSVGSGTRLLHVGFGRLWR